MSNPNRGEVTLKLDRERLLRFDFNALAEFENEMGRSMLSAIQSMQDKDGNTDLSFKLIRALIWAGLLHQNPTLTVLKAGEYFEQAEGNTLIEKLTNVFAPIISAIFDKFGDEEAKKKSLEIQESLKGRTG